jgi:hypothetical protein
MKAGPPRQSGRLQGLAQQRSEGHGIATGDDAEVRMDTAKPFLNRLLISLRKTIIWKSRSIYNINICLIFFWEPNNLAGYCFHADVMQRDELHLLLL